MKKNQGTLGPLVLCQDCLAVKEYTDARHINEEKCECGGDFCGCYGCNKEAEEIKEKKGHVAQSAIMQNSRCGV